MRALLVLLLLATPALADDDRTAHAVDPRPRETEPATEAPVEAEPAPAYDPTAPDVEQSAPRPDQASGITSPPPEGSTARAVGRTLLFVPRWAFWTIAQPFRFGAYAYEHYRLQERVKRTLFDDTGTYGVYPVASFTTDFGFDLGARFVHYDLFGEKERLKLRANFGGRYQQGYGFEVRSGERFGKRVSASLETIYERRPNERFFGIGNTRRLEDEMPAMPFDPTLADTAISSRFREDWFRSVARLESKLAGPLSVRVSGAVALREFADYETIDPGDPTDPEDQDDHDLGIEQRFDTSRLVGYERGVDNVYLEAELVYDSRRPTTRFMPRVVDSTGWYLAAHAGRAVGIAGDPTAFWRYGGEVQRFFDLYRGSRILTLRALVDATSGGDGRTDPTISFIDLPRLGGTDYLRGYPEGRFRDRAVALVTAEYTWDLGNFLAAYTFVDAGRAFRGLERVEADSIHLGFGGGIQLHTNASFLMRGQLAFSREGDAFVELVLSPAFGRRERTGRY